MWKTFWSMSFFLRLNIRWNYRKPLIQQEMINVFQNCTFFIKLVKKKKKKKKIGTTNFMPAIERKDSTLGQLKILRITGKKLHFSCSICSCFTLAVYSHKSISRNYLPIFRTKLHFDTLLKSQKNLWSKEISIVYDM